MVALQEHLGKLEDSEEDWTGSEEEPEVDFYHQLEVAVGVIRLQIYIGNKPESVGTIKMYSPNL
jgi:hypothetical protein